jgi:hypothetical protein
MEKTYVINLAGRDPRSALNEHAEGTVTVSALSKRHAVGAPLRIALHHQHPVINGVELRDWRVTSVRRAV